MRIQVLLPVALCLSLAARAAADEIFSFVVDTSSITGAAGSLDFNFDPGPILSQMGMADILSFSSDGSLAGSPSLTGDASGALPATVTFDNGSALNDYFEGFTFGSSLTFEVRLYGPAMNSPDGVSMSGSSFAFSMFSDPGGTVPALTTDATDGFAITLDVNLDGSVTPTFFSSQATLAPSAVPEPTSTALLGLCFAVLGIANRRKHRMS